MPTVLMIGASLGLGLGFACQCVAAGGRVLAVDMAHPASVSGLARTGGACSSPSRLCRASKAALSMVVASARHDPPRATLVALSPGWVQTGMGGDQAPWTAAHSVAVLRSTLARLAPAHSGRFLQPDGSPFASW